MVLIAACVFSKSGKILVARQFVNDMTKARLEGLLDAFPKLIGNEKEAATRQHTFVETDSVRYVYHPLDNIYMTLVTTKNSNILEDLETLRLFVRVIPEYCRSNEEKEILNNAFDLVFAFDEIVTLGYRESVNLAQIRTFTEMDSHEERVFMQIKEAQEKAAKQAMAEKAKELKRAQKEALSRGLKPSYQSSTGISSSSVPSAAAVSEPVAPRVAAPKGPIGGGKALKLGGKTTNEDDFLNTLRQQGQSIASVEKSTGAASLAAPVSTTPRVKREAVHVRTDEKINARVSRDGGLESGEVQATVSLSVASPDLNSVAIQMSNTSVAGTQLQVHPNLDKKEWQTSSVLKVKPNGKPYPVNSDVGILKWKMALTEEEQLPISLNCWPQEGSDGVDVNIEYTLQREDITLQNVRIIIPLPTATSPVVGECEGSYEYHKTKNVIVWSMPVIDSSNPTGTLEFSVPNGHSDHFFPVTVGFTSENLFVPITVKEVSKTDGSAVVFSVETNFNSENFEIV
uniref:Coatomer subunit delta n=1 Tax=Caenorhabditis tropicalis TaxID=1561998 RepID=A0A1I7UP54_9PELO